MYYFISGYTAKLAGTEKGLGSEPKATFSACFGAPFMALHPTAYASLLADKIKRHNVPVWLVNTGWTGGPPGVGERMSIKHTRAMVKAALTGELENVATTPHPFFGVAVPQSCPGVPQDVLDPQTTWDSPDAYETAARELVGRFQENFKRFKNDVDPEVLNAGPRG
jgi:phosphoenolpyruvate carboxykinase (ATP)